MINIKPSIVQNEFIGLETQVVRSLNKSLKGISGKVINETRNTFTILDKGKKKVVIKDTAVFNFVTLDGIVVEIDGKVINGRPEDRIKKQPRRLW